MRFSQFATIIGCTTAAVLSIAPIKAEAATIYQIQSGVTSVFHPLSQLSAIGLDFTTQNDTVAPISSDYLFGFSIAPNSTLRFSDENGFTSISGTIEHTGTLTFTLNDKIPGSNHQQLTIGNFSVGFAPNRTVPDATGLVLRDTLSLKTILFDLSAPQVSFNGKDLTLSKVNLLISPELASILGNPNLAGTVGGNAQINAKVVPVPESDSALATLAGGAAVLAARFYTKKIKYT